MTYGRQAAPRRMPDSARQPIVQAVVDLIAERGYQGCAQAVRAWWTQQKDAAR